MSELAKARARRFVKDLSDSTGGVDDFLKSLGSSTTIMLGALSRHGGFLQTMQTVLSDFYREPGLINDDDKELAFALLQKVVDLESVSN